MKHDAESVKVFTWECKHVKRSLFCLVHIIFLASKFDYGNLLLLMRATGLLKALNGAKALLFVSLEHTI